MGCACPYASPPSSPTRDRPVFAFVGDGAMQMNGMNELLTVAKYRDRWIDPRFVVLVLNNRDLNMVTWEQRAIAGQPQVPGVAGRSRTSLARFAELVGLRGIRVDRPEDVGRRGTRRLPRPPAVIDAVVDPECRRCRRTSPSRRRATSHARLLKGDPGSGDIMQRSVREKLAEFLPRR